VFIVQTITGDDNDQALLYLSENAFLCGGASGCVNAREIPLALTLTALTSQTPGHLLKPSATKAAI